MRRMREAVVPVANRPAMLGCETLRGKARRNLVESRDHAHRHESAARSFARPLIRGRPPQTTFQKDPLRNRNQRRVRLPACQSSARARRAAADRVLPEGHPSIRIAAASSGLARPEGCQGGFRRLERRCLLPSDLFTQASRGRAQRCPRLSRASGCSRRWSIGSC
jgi:hypothetical protein